MPGTKGAMTGEEVRAIRLALGLTQAELAQRVGISRTFLGLMERGARRVSSRTALAIQAVKPGSRDRVSHEPDPSLRRLENALLEQGVDFRQSFQSEGQHFDFYLPELSLGIVVDREATSQPRPTRDVRNVIVARGASASAIVSLMLEGRPLRTAFPVRLPISL